MICKSMSRDTKFSTWTQVEGICFRQERHQVSGLTHDDDFVLTGPTERPTNFENKMTDVYPIKAKVISYGSSESIKALGTRLHWGKLGIVHQHDPRHVDVLVKNLGLEHGNSVQTPATHGATRIRARVAGSSSAQQVQVASCKMFVPRSRSSGHDTHCERVLSKRCRNSTQQSLAKWKRLCQIFGNARDDGVTHSAMEGWSKE